jgi:hypothetical protein
MRCCFGKAHIRPDAHCGILKRNSFAREVDPRFKWIAEFETGCSGICVPTAASIGKGRQIAAMPAGISSLSAGISKEIPAIWAKHYYIQRSLMMNPSI